MPVESSLNLLFKMALPKIIIHGCLSKETNCTIPMKVIHDVSKLNFNGQGELYFRVHVLKVMTLFHRY